MTAFFLPLDIENIKEEVAKKATETFPLDPERIIFDWRELIVTEKERIIQVFALSRQFLQDLSLAAHKAGFHIEAFEPLSYSLARLTGNQKEAHLILISNKQILAVAAYKGGVLMSTMIEQPLAVKEILDFVKEKFNLEIRKVIVSGQLREDLKTNLLSLKIEIVFQILDPIFSLALKSDLKGKDAQVLNLEPQLPLDKKE